MKFGLAGSRNLGKKFGLDQICLVQTLISPCMMYKAMAGIGRGTAAKIHAFRFETRMSPISMRIMRASADLSIFYAESVSRIDRAII